MNFGQSQAPAPQATLLPLPEFRRRLGNVSKATIYRWEHDGKINLIRIGGRTFGSEAELARLSNVAAA